MFKKLFKIHKISGYAVNNGDKVEMLCFNTSLKPATIETMPHATVANWCGFIFVIKPNNEISLSRQDFFLSVPITLDISYRYRPRLLRHRRSTHHQHISIRGTSVIIVHVQYGNVQTERQDGKGKIKKKEQERKRKNV